MNQGRQSLTLIYLATFILVVVALYFGKPILMPLALAVLFAFLLSPVVNSMVRAGLGRNIAVILVVALVFTVLGAMIWGVGQQMSRLVYELPAYKDNVREKIIDLRDAGKGSALERIRDTWRELKGELKNAKPKTNDVQAASAVPGEPDPEPESGTVEQQPVPVVVQDQGSSPVWQIPSALGPLLEILATAGLVIVLVIFMLLRKRELRNRFIVLFGYSRMPTTTRALDEAAERISRYLLMQTIINGTYGIAVGISLYFLGLPYALVWGILAALLRFIPYVGPFLGATLPVLLSLAVFPGWFHTFVVLGIILALELTSNMVMEPLLYGQTVGVSEVALLAAVAFWTWIWGGIGLVLATPLTVCVAVLGKYVPGLSFLQLILGDEPVMEAPQAFYQRLLAMDKLEAMEIAEAFGKNHKLVEVYDKLVLPALITAKKDHRNHALSDEHLQFILATISTIIGRNAGAAREEQVVQTPVASRKCLVIPIDDAMDEVIVKMLEQLLPPWLEFQTLSSQTLTGEVIETIERENHCLVFLGALPPGGSAELKLLAKKIVAKFPDVKVVIARWGMNHPQKMRDLSLRTGVKSLASTLAEARNLLMQISQLKPSGTPTVVVDQALSNLPDIPPRVLSQS